MLQSLHHTRGHEISKQLISCRRVKPDRANQKSHLNRKNKTKIKMMTSRPTPTSTFANTPRPADCGVDADIAGDS